MNIITTNPPEGNPDFLDREQLLDLEIDSEVADKLLRASYHTGHDRRPVIDSVALGGSR